MEACFFTQLHRQSYPKMTVLEQRGQSSTSLYRRGPFKGVHPLGLSSRLSNLLWLSNLSFIKNKTQTAVINIVSFRIFINLTFRMLFNTHFQK